MGAVMDPVTNEKQEKAVFVVFFAGERARTKILKVGMYCDRLCCLPLVPSASIVLQPVPSANIG